MECSANAYAQLVINWVNDLKKGKFQSKESALQVLPKYPSGGLLGSGLPFTASDRDVSQIWNDLPWSQDEEMEDLKPVSKPKNSKKLKVRRECEAPKFSIVKIPAGPPTILAFASIEEIKITGPDDIRVLLGVENGDMQYHVPFQNSSIQLIGFHNSSLIDSQPPNAIASKIGITAFGPVYILKYDLGENAPVNMPVLEFHFFWNLTNPKEVHFKYDPTYEPIAQKLRYYSLLYFRGDNSSEPEVSSAKKRKINEE